MPIKRPRSTGVQSKGVMFLCRPVRGLSREGWLAGEAVAEAPGRLFLAQAPLPFLWGSENLTSWWSSESTWKGAGCAGFFGPGELG